MANSKGTTSLRNFPCTGKQSLLPPKSPFRSISPTYADYGSSSIGLKGIPKPKEGHSHHHHTSSESFLIEEPPSWFDDLLNEAEAPLRRGTHRRSSSDSFAFLEASSNSSSVDNIAQENSKHKNLKSAPTWGSLDFNCFKDVRHSSFYTHNFFGKQQNLGWESSLNSVTYPSWHQCARDNILFQSSRSSGVPLEPDVAPSTATKKKDQVECGPHHPQGSSERSDCSCSKPSASETDPKHARQQFAQRSRVRKLQYIAELERNVQVLQAEGSEVLAELDFLQQQNLILNMENKALKQQLDCLAQEQLVKCLEQELLEREMARLRALLHQQQHQNQLQQRPHSIHYRRSSRDLDSQFISLSLKHKDAISATESVGGGPLRT